MQWTRNWLFAMITCAAAGCTAPQAASQTTPKRAAEAEVDHPSFVVITMDKSRDRYVIDPRSESCLLILGRTASESRAPVHVSCSALARNLPAAAEHIKWIGKAADERAAATGYDKFGIAKLSDRKYRVRRRLFTELNYDSFGKGARLVPAIKNGQPSGFKIYAIRPSSVYARLGMLNGDRIISINGKRLTTPDTALEIYADLPTAHRVRVDIERRGEPTTLTYEIVD